MKYLVGLKEGVGGGGQRRKKNVSTFVKSNGAELLADTENMIKKITLAL